MRCCSLYVSSVMAIYPDSHQYHGMNYQIPQQSPFKQYIHCVAKPEIQTLFNQSAIRETIWKCGKSEEASMTDSAFVDGLID